MLETVSEHRRLSVPFLRSLGHFVQLWPDLLIPQIIGRLVDHLTAWLDLASQELASSSQLWRDPEGATVASAIIDVLASTGASHAADVVDKIVEPVLAAESRLGRQCVSPYRPPLTRFLLCCSDRAVEYLMDRLTSTPHVRLFCALLRSPQGSPFCSSLLARMDAMIAKGIDQGLSQVEAATGQTADRAAVASQLLFNAVAVLRSLAIAHPSFLDPGSVAAERVARVLSPSLFSARVQHEELLPCTRVSEPKLLVKLLLEYARRNPKDTDILLRLLGLLQLPLAFDGTSLRKFFYFEIPRIYPMDAKRAILLKAQSILHDRGYTQSLKADVFEKLAVPILAAASHQGCMEELMGSGEEGFLNKFVRQALLNQNSIEYEDSLKIAVMQVLLSLVLSAKKSPAILKEMVSLKQEYLGFVWNYCYVPDNPTFNRVWPLDDITVKYAGYVVVTAMMDLFEYCPPKMLMPLYESLLEAMSQDHKALALQAADYLVPLLGRFLPNDSEGRPPQWISRLRDVLNGDSHTAAHHAWSLIQRKPDVYYTHSAILIPWLVQSLSRLSQSPPTVDTRRPTTDLAELIIQWEIRRSRDVSVTAPAASASVGPSNSISGGSTTAVANSSQSVSSMAGKDSVSPMEGVDGGASSAAASGETARNAAEGQPASSETSEAKIGQTNVSDSAGSSSSNRGAIGAQGATAANSAGHGNQSTAPSSAHSASQPSATSLPAALATR